MKSVWGTELKVLEKIHPGIMVDSTGTLYYITPDAGSWFGGKAFYIGRINTAGNASQVGLEIDKKVGSNYAWPWDGMNSIESDATFSKIAWIPLVPCMAQETNGTTDYVHAIIYVVPSRWWNTSSGADTEGLLFVRIKKSDLSVAAFNFVGECWNLRARYFGKYETVTYNKNVFTSIYDVGLGRTSVYWLNNFKNDTYDESVTYLNYHVSNDAGSKLANFSCTYGDKKEHYKHCIEPRIMKVGNKYYFSTGHAYSPSVLTANPSTGDTTHFAIVPYMGTFDDHGSYGCCYHNDLNVINIRDERLYCSWL
jgi:hypothetical protein